MKFQQKLSLINKIIAMGLFIIIVFLFFNKQNLLTAFLSSLILLMSASLVFFSEKIYLSYLKSFLYITGFEIVPSLFWYRFIFWLVYIGFVFGLLK